jgi:uroporphyrin-III C-methyltransferase / precorrin-2 dehydrogenase / sirohydrochlorin ferrochelatase
MKQLPIFVNLSGRNVVLLGEGEAAEAKRRLIERAGGKIVADCPAILCTCARIGFVAIEGEDAAILAAQALRAKGLLVNVVDRPEHCDFTTPAIIDRDPVLIAIGTGGASAGMAKAIRQRIEMLLPQGLGTLALAISSARDAIRARFPDSTERRRALDSAFAAGAALDPMREAGPQAVEHWLSGALVKNDNGLIEITLLSADPEDLTLRMARLLGEADHVFHDSDVPSDILNRARADAVRHMGGPDGQNPTGLVLFLRLPKDIDNMSL